MTTTDKTTSEMDRRLLELQTMREKRDLTLRTASELDAIEHYGLQGWQQGWLRKHTQKGMR